MANRKEIIRIYYRGFSITYNDDKNQWEAETALQEKISSSSLKAIKARLIQKERVKFKPLKAYHKSYSDEFKEVTIYQMNEKGTIFFKDSANRKDHDELVKSWWGGDRSKFQFFQMIPENTGKIKQIEEKKNQIKQLEKEIEKLQNQMKPIKKIKTEPNPDDEDSVEE